MSFQPWGKPDPQSVAGLNSAMVYGQNIQFTVGLNHQVALGSNLQLCINPGVLFDSLNVPGASTLSGLWGSGPGGNMQFTIGSNANITWGRQFQINMGPEQVTINVDQHKPFTMIMSCLIGSACLAHAIAYGLITDENDRATAVIAFQTTIDVLLAAFMAQQMRYKDFDTAMSEAHQKLYGVPDLDHTTALQGFEGTLSAVALVGAAIAPSVAIATEEGHFVGETQDSSS
jgi:hypothetical protein